MSELPQARRAAGREGMIIEFSIDSTDGIVIFTNEWQDVSASNPTTENLTSRNVVGYFAIDKHS